MTTESGTHIEREIKGRRQRPFTGPVFFHCVSFLFFFHSFFLRRKKKEEEKKKTMKANLIYIAKK
jgi:hypothetical protein